MALNEQEKEQFNLLVQSFQNEKIGSSSDSSALEDNILLKNKEAIRNRYVYGVFLFLIGLGALVSSVALQTAVWVGVAAFSSMLGGSVLIYGGYRYSRFYGDVYVPIRLPWKRH